MPAKVHSPKSLKHKTLSFKVIKKYPARHSVPNTSGAEFQAQAETRATLFREVIATDVGIIAL